MRVSREKFKKGQGVARARGEENLTLPLEWGIPSKNCLNRGEGANGRVKPL